MNWRRIRLVLVVLIATGAVAAVAFDDQWLARNFRVVETGLVFRGGEQKPWPLERLIVRHGVRTVLCLADPEPREQFVAQSLGVQWLHTPLGDDTTENTFDRLEQAAAIVADSANRPVFFHCKRGVYRSNLVQAVYRVKFSGWTLEDTLNELTTMGFDPAASGGDNACREFLLRYYAERIAARPVEIE